MPRSTTADFFPPLMVEGAWYMRGWLPSIDRRLVFYINGLVRTCGLFIKLLWLALVECNVRCVLGSSILGGDNGANSFFVILVGASKSCLGGLWMAGSD